MRLHVTAKCEFVDDDAGTGALPIVKPDDAAQIQYTSGTTGSPKGALLHHRGLTNNARAFAELTALGEGDVYAHAMSFLHTAGCGLHGFSWLDPLCLASGVHIFSLDLPLRIGAKAAVRARKAFGRLRIALELPVQPADRH